MNAARAQNFRGTRTIPNTRAGLGTLAGGYGGRINPSAGNMGNRAGNGNYRSFGNAGFSGMNRAGNLAAVSHVNNFNRTNVFNNRVGGFNQTSFYGNRFNNLGYRGYGYGWRNPYYGYHRGWYNGFWGGYSPWGYGNGGYGWGYPYGFGYGFGSGLGYGLGWGLSNWLYGSSLYGYGYSSYNNPYYSAGTTVVMVPYNYAQPINTLGAAPPETVTDNALTLFGTARDAFKQGNYGLALQQTDGALAQTPNDSALHEFRGLCLFALGRYDEAATSLYAVLSVGPGWDWPTMIGLYPNVDAYTAQLRKLEAYCGANPQAAGGRFVLAYHYLTEGFLDPAATILRQVVALKPNDAISSKLLQQIEAAAQNKPGAAGPAPAPAVAEPAANAALPLGATIAGAWNAQPTADTSITLSIDPAGPFTWQVTRKGQTQRFSGTSTFGGGVLTLAQDKGPALVGRVSWTDPAHMTFRLVGNGPEDPGLSFSK